MPGEFLLNGEPSNHALGSDRGLHFGDGLFETIAVINGAPCLWARHFFRLQLGCERLGIALPAQDSLLVQVNSACRGHQRAVLKLIVTAGSVERGYARADHAQPNVLLRVSPWPQHLNESAQPLTLDWCQTRLAEQPLLAGIKHLNRLEQVLARREFTAGQDEGVMRDYQDNVIEGVSSNLIVREGDAYRTPKLDHCGIAGVVRGLMLDMAKDQGIDFSEARLQSDDLLKADALYLSNSLMGVRAVGSLAAHSYPDSTLPPFLAAVHAACFDSQESA